MIVDDGAAFRCARCRATKPLTLEHFYLDRLGRVTGYCRPCQRAYLRAWEGTLDPYALARRRAYQRANRWRRAGRPQEATA